MAPHCLQIKFIFLIDLAGFSGKKWAKGTGPGLEPRGVAEWRPSALQVCVWAPLAASSQAAEPAAGPRVGGDGGGTPASPGLCFSPLRHEGQMRVCPPAHGLGPSAEGHQCQVAKGGCSAHKWQSYCSVGGSLAAVPPAQDCHDDGSEPGLGQC